ncbi:MAG: aminoglycoside phosphotransferase family protein, partial [Lentimicrobium sp.]|nr:aminoglycoside phosphotransferase family protein [Lentimicrobium sp.]
MDFPITLLSRIFRIPGLPYTSESVQSGHINTTYRILEGNNPVYILQRVNVDIFKDIHALMSNYQVVADNYTESFLPSGEKLSIPEIIKTHEGHLFFTDEQNGHWRLITHLQGTDGSYVLRNKNTSYQGGLAFGAFLKGLSEINPEKLQLILPDFHSLERRFGEFQNALEKNAFNRTPATQQEIEFISSRFQAMMKIPNMIARGDIPLRVVHNDTKLSNVIYNKSDKAIGVIDLDTVMPGSALFDFGDAIRSCANTAAEDEPELSEVSFDIGLFESFSKGYLETAGTILNKKEIR